MFRIDHSTAAGALPAPGAAGTEGYFTDGDPGGGVAATVVQAWFLNMVQEELRYVVTQAGETPDKADNTQLYTAIQQLITDALPTVAEDRVFVDSVTFEGTVADGDAVRWDAGNTRFAKAVADGTANNRAVGVADVTASEVTIFGTHTTGISGLTPGARQYLDASTAGALTETAPADVVSMGLAKAAGILWVDVDATPAGGVAHHRATETTDVALATCASGGTRVGGAMTVDLPDKGQILLAALSGTLHNADGTDNATFGLGLEVNGTVFWAKTIHGSGDTGYPPCWAAGPGLDCEISGSWAWHPAICQAIGLAMFDIEEAGMSTGPQTCYVRMGDCAYSGGSYTKEGVVYGATGNPAAFALHVHDGG